MFTDIQHIGYLTRDLEEAAAWYAKAFGATNAGGTMMQPSPMVPSGGRNAFIRFGHVEVELMEPKDKTSLKPGQLVLHHIGWLVSDIAEAAADARARGIEMLVDAPYTNPMGQKIHYFNPGSTNGLWMHLTEVAKPAAPVAGTPSISRHVHPGILVRDLDAATRWYVEKFSGTKIGGGPSRTGGQIAFIDCGTTQIELIQPKDASAALGEAHVLDHIGYQTASLAADLPQYRARGLAFQTPEPAVNPVGQTLIYFDTATSMDTRIHLTELPK